MRILTWTVVLAYMVYLSCGFTIDEPCRKDAYPPLESTKLKTVYLNLDLPPQERWKEIVEPQQERLHELIDVIKELFPQKVITMVDIALGSIISWLPKEYSDEIKGVAAAAKMPLGEAVLYNIFYEIFSACTSIVAQDESGKLYHARNMDFGLFMGWDDHNNTWKVTEKLRPLLVNVEYQTSGKTVFKAVHFVGYVGVLTAVKPNAFTLTVNERFSLDGGYVGLIEWLMGISKGRWLGFLTRDVLRNATSYSEAKDVLTNTELLAPVYFILGGKNAGEAALITRSRESTVDTLGLNVAAGDWYLLETNYDHWKKPMFIDDRRTPAKKCLGEMTQKGLGYKGLFNVLSTKPNLNKLTTYTTLMQVNDGTMDTYLQDCPDPCWPW